jgi:outer membrane protein TolC
MHDAIRHIILVAIAALCSATSAFGQSGGRTPLNLTAAGAQSAPAVRRLSVDDAVRLAVEQNLGIRIERINPQIQDVALAETRGAWAPTLSSNVARTSRDTAVTNVFAGGQNTVTTSVFSTNFGVAQRLPTGGEYSVAWDSSRQTSTNFFNTFDPQLLSNLTLDVTQPLLRNLRIDNVRQQLALNQKARESADVNLQATITQTVRNVKNAYWDLTFQINNLNAQRQSLDLAKRVLADNEKRVQIGTMAPIDIVEAQSEVARNEETVIVAEAAIEAAEDRLRTLIFDPAAPDFWSVAIEPADTAPFQAQAVDVEGAVGRALANRTDLRQARNGLEQNDISIRYLRNQVLPEINANVSYGAAGVGGTRYFPIDFTEISGSGVPQRIVQSERGFGDVLGDVFGSTLPTWTFAVQIGYPVGTSVSEANLARARLEYSQAQTRLRNLELSVTSQVRDAARNVQTNQKRVDSTRAARGLAERRLDAAEKKFAAGIETSFFVFQAQRDLAQARTAEVRAIADYNKSLVDFEAVQEVPLQ